MSLRPAVDAAIGTGKHKADTRWVAANIDGPVGGDPQEPGVYPLDEHNAKLLDNVAPKAWVNPRLADGPPDGEMYYDIVAIGAGAGGLVSAKQSARRGLRSALVERHLAGGDCLNVGCVPSKGLIRCARAAAEIKAAAEFGSIPTCKGPTHRVDFGKIMARMREARARIAPADALEVSAGVGAACFFGKAEFTSPDTVRVALHDGSSRNLRFGTAVIATGGSAAVPPLPGLSEAPYHTNATLYNMTELPRSMVVIGAGPIGLEMAQAFALFGSSVTVVSPSFMRREDPEAAQVVRASLERDGVSIRSAKITKVEVIQNSAGWTAGKPCCDARWPSLRVSFDEGGSVKTVDADCVLVAAGRTPNVKGLGLEAAGVEYDLRNGVKVNDFLRTSNPKIYAVGDVCSKFQFTHVSGTHAQMVVQNALFGGQRRVSDMVVPWCTYTEPEVAHVGAYEHELRARGVECDTYKSSFEHNDRAILEAATNGFVKIICKKGSEEILGATIVAPAAGEMISELTLAIQFNIPLGTTGLGGVIHPYPTMADGVGGCAFACKRKGWEWARPNEGRTGYKVFPPEEPLSVPAQRCKVSCWLPLPFAAAAGFALGAAVFATLSKKAKL